MNIAFTGSRPNKLWGYDLKHFKYENLRKILEDKLLDVIKDSNCEEFKFICGGALGFDTIAAQVVLKIREENPSLNIKIEIAIPFKDQPNAWFNKVDIDRYNIINKLVDIVTYVDTVEGYIDNRTPIGNYSAKKLQVRNVYMINNSDLVVALYDGTKGGTHNAVTYAKKINKKILVINPKEI